MRISALSEGEFEKAAFGLKILRQVALLPAKSKTPKRLAASKVADVSGVTRALRSLVGWQCRYTVFECHNYNNRPRKAVGAKFDSLYEWLVNETECADRLIRLHYPSIVALTGREVLPEGY